jgi:type I restriction enzyme, S subunit
MGIHNIVPTGWKELALGEFLIPEVRKVEKPSKKYVRLGIRSHGKGTFTTAVDNPDDIAMDWLYEVRKDDLIVSITFAWEGAIALVKETDEIALVSHRFPTYTFRRDIVVPEYFRYVILTKRFVYDLGTISPGGAGRNRVLNKSGFLKLRLPVPPIKEQYRIAELLQSWDNGINKTEKLISAKQRLKKGVMQSLLAGEKRYPGFASAWEETTIGKVAEITAGGTPGTKTPEYWGGDIR